MIWKRITENTDVVSMLLWILSGCDLFRIQRITLHGGWGLGVPPPWANPAWHPTHCSATGDWVETNLALSWLVLGKKSSICRCIPTRTQTEGWRRDDSMILETTAHKDHKGTGGPFSHLLITHSYLCSVLFTRSLKRVLMRTKGIR